MNVTRSRSGRARDARSAPSARASSDRRDARRRSGGSERGAAVGGDLITGVDGSDRGEAGGTVADGDVGGDAGFASSNLFSADPRALRRRRFRRARTVTFGEGVQTSSAASKSQLASREAARCRNGVVVAAREGHFSCPSCGRAPAAALCCPDPESGCTGFLCATAPRGASACVSAILAARGRHRMQFLAPRQREDRKSKNENEAEQKPVQKEGNSEFRDHSSCSTSQGSACNSSRATS